MLCAKLLNFLHILILFLKDTVDNDLQRRNWNSFVEYNRTEKQCNSRICSWKAQTENILCIIDVLTLDKISDACEAEKKINLTLLNENIYSKTTKTMKDTKIPSFWI